MRNYTFEELKAALGHGFTLIPFDEEKLQIRVLAPAGDDLAFIDLGDGGLIEGALYMRWHDENVAEGFPDEAAIEYARQEIREELQFDWEHDGGFIVEDEGSVMWLSYANDPDKKLPMYELTVSKEVPTLEEAVRTIQWMSQAEGITWA